jgi:hypothetical protein
MCFVGCGVQFGDLRERRHTKLISGITGLFDSSCNLIDVCCRLADTGYIGDAASGGGKRADDSGLLN